VGAARGARLHPDPQNKRNRVKKLSQEPEYLAAVAKLNAIASADARTLARMTEIEAEMARPGPHLENIEMAERIIENLSTPGRHVLNETLQAEHLQLRGHREVLRNAQQEQTAVLQSVVERLGINASAQLAARHKAIAKLAAQKLREFDAAQDQERALFDELRAFGYEPSSRLEWVRSPVLGTLHTLPAEESLLSMRIKELEQYAGRGQG